MTVFDAQGRENTTVLNELLVTLERSGISVDTKFGRVRNIDAADTPCDVWALADDAASPRLESKTFPSAASTLYMASDDAADTAEVTVEYIDSFGFLQTVTDNLTGQTPVNLGVSGFDSNRAYLSGDDESNVGNVFVSHDADWTAGVPDDLTQTLCHIPPGYGQTEQCLYRVPIGKKCFILGLNLTVARSGGAAGSADVRILTKESGGSWLVKRDYPIQNGGMPFVTRGLSVGPGGFFRLEVNDVSDIDTNVTADIIYYLRDA